MRVGLYNRRLVTLGGGERHSLAIAAYLARRDHEVQVIGHTPVDLAAVGQRLGLDLRGVEARCVPARPPHELGEMTAVYDLFINASNWDFVPPQAHKNALLVYFPYPAGNLLPAQLRFQIGNLLRSRVLAPLYPLLFERWWRAAGVRLANPIHPDFLTAVRGYDLIWANSEFTRHWISRYWMLPADLLYPPVAVHRFKPGIKKRTIVSVGRFFSGVHNKQHGMMIDVFRQLLDQGVAGWTLQLIGALTPGQIHQEYLDNIRIQAQGYPIELCVDVPFDRLVQLYGAGAIYWHAAGYGVDEQKAPDRLEHFGITTVEAMAAGCVPVVLGKGGQTEIVRPGHDGFLWYTSADLVAQTRRLIENTRLRDRLSAAAVEASRRFDQHHFEAQLAASLNRLELCPT